jgi:hypothetical protein
MRSGNHAIIEWIASHYKHAAHHNDITRTSGNNFIEYGVPTNPVDCTIYSVETILPFNAFVPAWPLDIDPGAHRLGILRDYYNMQASAIRLSRKFAWARRVFLLNKQLWPGFAEAYLARPSTFVLFNRWTSDSKYLLEIEQLFGWHHVPRSATLPKSGVGGGSSFNNLAGHNDRWAQMDSNDWAWREVLNSPKARELNEQIFGWAL